MSLTVYYLNHSGFVVETDTKILVFDYYKDPSGIVDKAAKTDKPFWFFVSHNHSDHFNPHIGDFACHTAYYIYNENVPFTGGSEEQRISMAVYTTVSVNDVEVTQYGSTDEGGSFLVKTDEKIIFHAGDLNWWHWDGDTEENKREADNMFAQELHRLTGVVTDIAFFPVDARLGRVREWGVTAFADTVAIRTALISMHYFGTPWVPSREFKARHNTVPLWIPQVNGDKQTF